MRRMRSFTNWATVVIFTLTLVPLLTFSTKPWSDPVEKRRSADFPTAPQDFSQIAKFQRGIEAYFNDHFGYRNTLIDTRTTIDFWLLAHSSNPLVLIGQNNWLYFTGKNCIEDFMGQCLLSPQDLDTWAAKLKERHDWLAKQGIAYYFIFAPNKQSIYPENMPSYIQRGESTGLDQLKKYLATKGDFSFILDSRADLIAQKGKLPLYYAFDVHWNAYGAYLEYRNIIKRLVAQDQKKGITEVVLPEKDFVPVEVKTGDLALMMGFSKFPRASLNTKYVGPELPCTKTTPETSPEHVSSKPYSDFSMECPGDGRSSRLLIFRDSMISGLEKYLGNSFAHTRFVWIYPTTADIEHYVAVEKPDIVIEERVERTFVAPPDN